MIGFSGIKSEIAAKVYSVAKQGESVVLLRDVEGCIEGCMRVKGSKFTLREVDDKGIVYLEDSHGNLFCAPYVSGMLKKEEQSNG